MPLWWVILFWGLATVNSNQNTLVSKEASEWQKRHLNLLCRPWICCSSCTMHPPKIRGVLMYSFSCGLQTRAWTFVLSNSDREQVTVEKSVATFYSVLWCVAVCCDMLQCIAMCWVLVAVYCSACCSVLLHEEAWRSAAQAQASSPINALQHIATHCTALQHIATHCNALQHTATHCITL